MSRLRISGVIPLPALYGFMTWTGVASFLIRFSPSVSFHHTPSSTTSSYYSHKKDEREILGTFEATIYLTSVKASVASNVIHYKKETANPQTAVQPYTNK
jgi:hypothetical protein